MRSILAPLALLALAACSPDSLTAPTDTVDGPQFAKGGVSNPGTAIGSNFVIYVAGTTYYRGDGTPSRNGQGLCNSHADGTTGWYYVPGNFSNKKPVPGHENGPNHAQCREISPAYTITVTFGDVANYVLSASGNNELNFNSLCTPNADPLLAPTCVSRWVHYQQQSDWTSGTGILYGTGVSSLGGSSNWTIDLSQVNSNTNLISAPPRTLIVMAHNTDGAYPDSPASIKW